MESTVLTGQPSDLKELARRILAAERILLTTHDCPDGDGIGSMSALARTLEDHGKGATCLLPEPLPARYSFLDPDRRIVCLDDLRTRTEYPAWDLILVLDTHQWALLHGVGEWLRSLEIPVVFLDHHPQDTGGRTDVFGDPEAVATGELVYRLLHHHLGWSIPPQAAESLYASISFDTNSFKYIRSNPASLLIAADLITRGVDTNRIYRHLFASNSREKARLLGWVLSSVQFEAGGRVAFIKIPHRVVEELGLKRDEMRDSITHILEIQGVEVAAALKEMEPNDIKISIRSKGACAINAVAAGMGGGGHALAAGCDFRGSIDEAWKTLRGPLIAAMNGQTTGESP